MKIVAVYTSTTTPSILDPDVRERVSRAVDAWDGSDGDAKIVFENSAGGLAQLVVMVDESCLSAKDLLIRFIDRAINQR